MRPHPTHLVVILHGYMMGPNDVKGIEERVSEVWPDSDVYRPELNLTQYASEHPNDIVKRVLKDIDTKWGLVRHKEIVLIGHSVGSLLARKIYICACGDDTKQPFEPELNEWKVKSEWAGHVTRIILLAGMNRGWATSHHLTLERALLLFRMNLIGRAASFFRHLLIYDFHRGSPWITQLRIQWLAMRARAATRAEETAGTVTLKIIDQLNIEIVINDMLQKLIDEASDTTKPLSIALTTIGVPTIERFREVIQRVLKLSIQKRLRTNWNSTITSDDVLNTVDTILSELNLTKTAGVALKTVLQLHIERLDLEKVVREALSEAVRTSLLPGSATTIQLLGTRDDYVSPEDNVDLVSGGDFIYQDVPDSGHESIIKMGLNEKEPRKAETRAIKFKHALKTPVHTLESERPVDAAVEPRPANDKVTNVIFVMHGIRDEGYWTHRIARHIKRLASPSIAAIETKTSTYGYFPMLPFLLSWKRNEKVEWLMDQYAECLANYPKAKFSYVGHSNGTYLLARALEKYPFVRFHNVVFAGSVVRRAFPWTAIIEGARVNAVLNFVATRDRVVAYFPKVFQCPPTQDLGAAGHDGFTAEHEKVTNVQFVVGGHSSAINEALWDDIAYFILSERKPTNLTEKTWYQESRTGWDKCVEFVGKCPFLVWFVLIEILFAIGWVILSYFSTAGLGILIFVIYLTLIWKVLTKL